MNPIVARRERFRAAVIEFDQRVFIGARSTDGAFWFLSGYGTPSAIAQIEASVHELCHYAALGYSACVKIRAADPAVRNHISITSIVSSHLATNERSPAHQRRSVNVNEMLAVAVEILAMRLLQIGWREWHTRRLVSYASRALVSPAPTNAAFTRDVLASMCNPQVKRWARDVVGWIRGEL